MCIHKPKEARGQHGLTSSVALPRYFLRESQEPGSHQCSQLPDQQNTRILLLPLLLCGMADLPNLALQALSH